MPYIKQVNRPKFDKAITTMFDSFVELEMGDGDCEAIRDYKKNYRIPVGDVNYVISSVLWNMFDFNPSYANGNDIVGVLECIKQEFIRRKLSPYEDKKIVENGDIQ
jgi:hypothetical protein